MKVCGARIVAYAEGGAGRDGRGAGSRFAK